VGPNEGVPKEGTPVVGGKPAGLTDEVVNVPGMPGIPA